MDRAKMEELAKDVEEMQPVVEKMDDFVQKYVYILDIEAVNAWLELRKHFHYPLIVHGNKGGTVSV